LTSTRLCAKSATNRYRTYSFHKVKDNDLEGNWSYFADENTDAKYTLEASGSAYMYSERYADGTELIGTLTPDNDGWYAGLLSKGDGKQLFGYIRVRAEHGTVVSNFREFETDSWGNHVVAGPELKLQIYKKEKPKGEGVAFLLQKCILDTVRATTHNFHHEWCCRSEYKYEHRSGYSLTGSKYEQPMNITFCMDAKSLDVSEPNPVLYFKESGPKVNSSKHIVDKAMFSNSVC